MLYRSQKGFSALEAILIFVVVAIIGGTGWYVWQSRQETNKALDSSQDASDGTPKVTKITSFDECVAAGNPVAESYPEQCFANGKSFANPDQKLDETASWVSYESRDGRFKLKYPSEWVQADNLQYCSKELVLFGANKQSVGICGSDAGGQMVVSSYKGEQVYKLASPYYENVTQKTVTVSGVTGVRQLGYSTGNGEFAQPKGTKVVMYYFVHNGRVYSADYTAAKNYPDVLKDFDIMITKTFQFN